MRCECILLSDSNYDLAYNFRKCCMESEVELVLSREIVEALDYVSTKTKAIVIEADAINSSLEKYFPDDRKYRVFFLIGKKFYDLYGELVCEGFENFVNLEAFKVEGKEYSQRDFDIAIEKVFSRHGMMVTNWQGRFVKEVLRYMFHHSKPQIKRADIDLVAGSADIPKNEIYNHIAKFLKESFDEINRESGNTLMTYDTKATLECLYNLIMKELESKM